MRMAWIVGWIALFISLIFLNSIIEQGSGMSTEEKGWIDTMLQPVGVEETPLNDVPVVGAAVAIVAKVWNYLKIFIQAIILWYPSIWVGNWIWVYYFVCVPVTVGFIVSIILILRGSQSS